MKAHRGHKIPFGLGKSRVRFRSVAWLVPNSIRMQLLVVVCCHTAFTTRCFSAPRPLRTEVNAPPLSAGITNPPLREIQPGLFQLGGVRLDKSKRILEFAGVVNMSQGPVEYLLVHETGKVHESVLKTAVEPYHVHLAALLLQPKPGAINTNMGLAARELKGPTAEVLVRWKDASKAMPGEDLVFNVQTKAAMARGAWTYNGSRIIGGTFLAQRDGSIASVITDPDALLNGMRPGRDKDDLWQVNTNLVRAVNTPVGIAIQFHEHNKTSGDAQSK